MVIDTNPSHCPGPDLGLLCSASPVRIWPLSPYSTFFYHPPGKNVISIYSVPGPDHWG